MSAGPEITDHLRQAGAALLGWLRLSARLRGNDARRTSTRAALSAVLALSGLVWIEIALYLALGTLLPPWWAAFLVFLLSLVTILAAGVALRRRGASRAARLEAERHRLEARIELIAAKNEVADRAVAFYEDRVLASYERYRRPVALAGSFFVGVLVARALLPPSS